MGRIKAFFSKPRNSIAVGLAAFALFVGAVPVYYGSLNVPTGGTITDSNFTSGNCVQTTTGGLFTAAPCPTGAPGVSTITAGTNIVVTTPNPASPTVAVANAPTFSGAVTANDGLAAYGNGFWSLKVFGGNGGPPLVVSGPSGYSGQEFIDTSTPAPAAGGGATITFANSQMTTQPFAEILAGLGGVTPTNYGGYIVIQTKLDNSSTFLENMVFTHNGHVAALHTTLGATTTTPASCAALATCSTYTFTFDEPYTSPGGVGEAPYCIGPSFQDTTTATTIWIGSIQSVSSTAVTFQYAPTTATAAADTLHITWSCWSSSY